MPPVVVVHTDAVHTDARRVDGAFAGRRWPNVVPGRDGRRLVLGKFRMSFTVGNAVLALLLTAVGSTFFISRNFLARAVAATFYLHSTSAFEQQWMGGLKAVLLWAD